MKGIKPKSIASSIIHYAKKHLPLLGRQSSFKNGNHVPPGSTISAPSDADQRNLLEEIVELLPDQKIGAELDQAALKDLLIPNMGYSVETLNDIADQTDVYDLVEKEMEAFSFSRSSDIILSDDLPLVKETKVGHDSSRSTESNDIGSESSHKNAMEKGPKKKKGKSAGVNAKSAVGEIAANDQEYIPTKSKKTQRRGKHTSSHQVSDSKPGAKKDSAKMQEDYLKVPSEEWVLQKIMMLNHDFEEQGIDDPQAILRPLANYMRPKLINFLKERRKAFFTKNAERIKRLLDNMQKKVDEDGIGNQTFRQIQILKDLGLQDMLSVASSKNLLLNLLKACGYQRLNLNEHHAVMEILIFVSDGTVEANMSYGFDWALDAIVPDDGCRLVHAKSCVYIDSYGSRYYVYLVKSTCPQELNHEEHLQNLEYIGSVSLTTVREKLLSRSFLGAVWILANSIASYIPPINDLRLETIQNSLESVANKLQFVRCLHTRFLLLPKSIDITVSDKDSLTQECDNGF
ncbi:hypothetical protein QYF36_023217 [Acer negundo]|nr:hypothetical protein QYF36_023217 [Acer negundo]